MARTRRSRRSPPVLPPNISFRFIVIGTMGFVSFIVVVIILSFDGSNNKDPKASVVSKTTKVRFGSPEEIPAAVIASLDAILVLGGGVPMSINEPPLFTQKRIDHAAQVVQRYKHISKKKPLLPILCLSAGTAHLPQFISADGLPVWEATSSAAYLLKEYPAIIDKRQVYVETTSYDTIGNAFFARSSFTDISGWRNLLVVTNEFHMDRTQAIFEWIFGLDNSNSPGTNVYQLCYLASPNVGLTEAAVQARKEREAQSQTKVETILSKKYRSMKGVWTFLTQEHSFHTASKLVERGQGSAAPNADDKVDQAIKESYGLNKKEPATEESVRETDSL